MNVYLEIFGYIGSALLIISMMMTSMVRFRIINILGSIISTVYSVVHGANAIVFLNLSIMGIHIFHLVREFRRRAAAKKASAVDTSTEVETHNTEILEETQ